jgi:hypothetical protein
VEVDAEGDLLIQNSDWEGGINALRKDLEEMELRTIEAQERLMGSVKDELDLQLQTFRREVATLLEGVSDEMKKIHTLQSEGGITFSGKNVAKAVKAVKSIHKKGSLIFKNRDE